VLYLDRAGQFTTTRHGGIHRPHRDDQPTGASGYRRHGGGDRLS
jgi:hypothetical protein